jgi:methylmalonyl-CoA mutase, C-terminal domain
VDAIGVSMLSGAHEALLPMVCQKLAEAGAEIPVILGGIVPETDFVTMSDAGVAAVLTPGATAAEVVEAVRSAIEKSRS